MEMTNNCSKTLKEGKGEIWQVQGKRPQLVSDISIKPVQPGRD